MIQRATKLCLGASSLLLSLCAAPPLRAQPMEAAAPRQIDFAQWAPDLFASQDPSQTKPPDQSQANQKPPSLGDLGFPPSATQGSAAAQARLNKRSHMLKVHQKLGLITLAPMIATLAASSYAGGRHPDPTGRDVHAALGSVTAGMYFTTAYFAIFAPKIPGTPTRGPIKLHKFLAWIHGPGMVLTPILGAMAFDQEANGEKVHGIAKAHGTVAVVTCIAYGLSIASVSIRF